VTEFKNMLVRTYSNAIEAYQGQTLKVLPARGKADPEDTVVRTQFVRAGGQPLPIEFHMRQAGSTCRGRVLRGDQRYDDCGLLHDRSRTAPRAR